MAGEEGTGWITLKNSEQTRTSSASPYTAPTIEPSPAWGAQPRCPVSLCPLSWHRGHWVLVWVVVLSGC